MNKKSLLTSMKKNALEISVGVTFAASVGIILFVDPPERTRTPTMAGASRYCYMLGKHFRENVCWKNVSDSPLKVPSSLKVKRLTIETR